MARLPRLSIPGYPHHVIQRGNNGQAIFLGANEAKAISYIENWVSNQHNRQAGSKRGRRS